MSIDLTIRLSCDDIDDVLGLQSTLLQRYHRVSIDIDQTDHVEEADEDDVDPDMLISILNGMRAHATAPEAREAIDVMVAAMRGEPQFHPERIELARELDAAEARGRVRPDDSDAESRRIKAMIVDQVPCAQCKSKAGQVCRSPKGATYTSGFVHQARIDRWYAR